jgi:DEAD/DEAH box helicase domain-containing protein
VRRAALERDGHTCQVCGAGEPLDVHHKQPLRSFRSFEEGNRLENLISLCPNCHRRAEIVVAMRSGLAGLSFVLRHLAPLYLMCDPGDLGVHSDPRSDLAEGGPALVIFDNVGNALGFSERLFELHEELMAAALELVSACGCQDGCPSCVGPGGEQGQGSKRETLALLGELAALRQPAVGV